MKLQSKFENEDIGYGEVFDAKVEIKNGQIVVEVENENVHQTSYYGTFADFNEDWQDHKDPKGIINIGQGAIAPTSIYIDMATEEEARQAIKKLKAWQRLENKGIFFEIKYSRYTDEPFTITGDLGCTIGDETKADLDLLFGGEE